MKKIRKLIALVLAVCFITPTLFAVACATKHNNQTSSSSENVSQSQENSALLPEDSSTEENNSDTITPGQSDDVVTPDSSTSAPIAPDKDSTEPDQEDTPVVNPTPKNVASYIRCTGNNVNLRVGAGTDHKAVGQAEKGSMYAVIEQKDGWIKTYFRNQTVYLYASYATVFTLEKSETSSVEKVISEGYRLLGVPYVYGAIRLHDGKGNLLKGFSTQKFDCSSLIQYIFYKGAGKLLNTTTRTQVVQGKSVKKSEIQRGDCLFFTNEDRKDNVGIERVGHVALYLGDNYILHTASDYARIEKISATRWSYFLEARRFLS